jgi:hypothetical protein
LLHARKTSHTPSAFYIFILMSTSMKKAKVL